MLLYSVTDIINKNCRDITINYETNNQFQIFSYKELTGVNNKPIRLHQVGAIWMFYNNVPQHLTFW